MHCPACNHTEHFETATFGVYICQACNALHGHCHIGLSYQFVSYQWSEDPNPPQERWRYFDLECLGSKGMTRRHGWYDYQTKKILQTG